MHPSEVVAADELLGDRQQLVGEHHHVVAIPAHPAADVQQDLVQNMSTAEILSEMTSVG